MTRTTWSIGGKWYVFASEHPKEERVIELTDDYRGPDGEFILPEPVAWDGVESNPGIAISLPDDEEGVLE